MVDVDIIGLVDQSDLYEADFHAWVQAQAELLRDRRAAALDWGHLLGEVKNLGRSERHALQSALQNAMIHLLKLAYTEGSRDPENDWRHSVGNV